MSHELDDLIDERDDESEIRINAWTQEGPAVSAPAAADIWALRRSTSGSPHGQLAPPVIDLRDWQHEAVGWGVILPDDESIPVDQRHTAAGAPDCIQQLVAARGNAPVFRYNPKDPLGHLSRYSETGELSSPLLSMSTPRGRRTNELPWYLLIVGGPDVIPWEVQYHLNLVAYTGRLALEGEALENYVAALIDGWAGGHANRTQPVVWSTAQNGPRDITRLMAKYVADPVATRYSDDSELLPGSLRRLTGETATSANLAAALAEASPALVVTTSHGRTDPVDRPAEMLEVLGMLVDQVDSTIHPSDLLANWAPGGAIWYAHACCSAGSARISRFAGLVPDGSDVQKILNGVAGLGNQVSPFPTALLGASKPARAFIGHVEPTFDWTLRHPATNQTLSEGIIQSLYHQLFQAEPVPIGMAMEQVYRSVAGEQNRANEHRQRADDITKRQSAEKEMIRAQLLAHDRQSMVILGDPTVALPAPSRE